MLYYYWSVHEVALLIFAAGNVASKWAMAFTFELHYVIQQHSTLLCCFVRYPPIKQYFLDMGDVSMGLAYLCGGCCCLKDTDPGPEGSQITRTRKHPKENDIKMEFMSRNYQRDKDGRFHQAITEQPQAQTAAIYEKK
ncbi:uncharacterized protein C8R40DRAFT_1114283 [Lentinula edodes]|uniref:uncharacterized protein n=1 Tax=Lentinula edodes TaxID=5353 RepID=UPI001E8EA74D|nr:uncharacterized protein C8R40DRAFT_1114283 [Lentinula edodes]KAH7873190.1 hypothetical protein C8R40DRAFT_1114283 [Lentinula edodes]